MVHRLTSSKLLTFQSIRSRNVGELLTGDDTFMNSHCLSTLHLCVYTKPLVRVNVDNTFPSSGESEVGLIPSVH